MEMTVYVHMGWSMNYPFSPRTWSLIEWRRWLKLLKTAGVERIMLWPGLEFVDVTSRDEALASKEKLSSLILLCHELSLKIWIGRSLNAYVKDSNRKLELRDVTDCDYCDITNSTDYQTHILNPLKIILEDLPHMDGYWVIDRDPGLALNSRPSDFVRAFAEQLTLFSKQVTPVYWMWGGWTDKLGQPAGWREKSQDFWEQSLLEFQRRWPDDFKVLMCWNGHVKSGSKIKAENFRFPYHQVEPEPSVPWSYEERELACEEPLALLAPAILNLQTPCLRTPHLLDQLKRISRDHDHLRTTTWGDIEKSWCWSESSLKDLKQSWHSMRDVIEKDELAFEELETWKQVTGCYFPHKRGFLHDKFYG